MISSMDSTTYFIDRLTAFGWLRWIWPLILWRRVHRRQAFPQCYYVDGSLIAVLLVKMTAKPLGLRVDRVVFSLTGVMEESGTQSHLLVAYRGLDQTRKQVVGGPVFQGLVRGGRLPGRLPQFLAKSAVSGEPGDRGTIGHAQYMVHVCGWKNRTAKTPAQNLVLFLEDFPWFDQAQRYGADRGIRVVPVGSPLRVRNALRKRLPPWLVRLLRRAQHRRSSERFAAEPERVPVHRNGHHSGISSVDNGPKLWVESNGMLNVNRPELHSDLFFWQRSPLSGPDVLVSFAIPLVPLDEQQWSQLQEHGISAVVLHPGASEIPSGSVPLFEAPSRTQLPTKASAPAGFRRAEKNWLKEQTASYNTQRSYWAKFCEEYHVKVHSTQNKYDATHCAIADAVQSNGGVTALYQRAFESDPSPITTVSADVVFGFSDATAVVERRSGSEARYHVTTGYLGDHRFELLREASGVIRRNLQSHGAQRIMAFFDENSREDARWHFSHQDVQKNFGFLIQKVLDEPWFGLVIKPKLPRHLRMRLGPVAELLVQAEATGRCYVFDDNGFRGFHPPVAAGLAADIAVHSHLSAATAGVESALAGVPTLLLDQEGWSESPFYGLGTGKVVFTSWDDLWAACLDEWSSDTGGHPRLGDWSPMLEELDPFRDGRAAERMGTFLDWLLKGFKEGKTREEAMAEAAQLYGERWGADKITDINWDNRGLETYAGIDSYALQTSSGD